MSKWILDEADVENIVEERIKVLKQDRNYNKSMGYHSMVYVDSKQIDEVSNLFQKIRNKAVIVADAVEVIRCRDCRHWRRLWHNKPVGICRLYDISDGEFSTEENAYCSRGERREDDGNFF